MEGFIQSDKIQFEFEAFWVQLFNLPILYMNQQCGQQIGESLGKVMDVDVEVDDIGWGLFLRIRIEIN